MGRNQAALRLRMAALPSYRSIAIGAACQVVLRRHVNDLWTILICLSQQLPRSIKL
jgi:hypothetical protein